MGSVEYLYKGTMCRYYPDRIPESQCRDNEAKRQALADYETQLSSNRGLYPGSLVMVCQDTPVTYLRAAVTTHGSDSRLLGSGRKYVYIDSLEPVPEEQQEAAFAIWDLQNG